MRKSNRSITNIPSFRPELEFEVIKLILLRESYLKKLEKLLVSNEGRVNMSVIGVIDTLRDCSIETVELIETWEQTQLDYPNVKPFLWNNKNYLHKMCEDYLFLRDYPTVSDWLQFSPETNPFFIPPEVLTDSVKLETNAFVVFGARPPPIPKPPRARPIMPKFVKSPYLTPIHNDLDVFPQNSAYEKSKKKEKLRAQAQQAADAKQQLSIDKAKDAPTDPWQSFIGADVIENAKKRLSFLKKSNPSMGLDSSLLTMNVSGDYSPSASFVTAVMPPSTTSPMKKPPPPAGAPPGYTGDTAGSGGANTLPPPVKQAGGARGALGSRLDEGSLDSVEDPSHVGATDGSVDGPESSRPSSKDGSNEKEKSVTIVREPIRSPEQAREAGFGQREELSSPHRTSPNKGQIDQQGSMTSAAGNLASTSIFSQSREAFEETQQPFRESLEQTSVDEVIDNKAMRLQRVVPRGSMEGSVMGGNETLPGPPGSPGSVFTENMPLAPQNTDPGMSLASTNTQNKSQIWTPHEITLQRAVQRRGGELFVLTAAATKGRIKAPWRRTRFERLAKDLKEMDLQSQKVEASIAEKQKLLDSLMKESKGDERDAGPLKKARKDILKTNADIHAMLESKKGIDMWKHTLQEQYADFERVMDTDDITDKHKARAMVAQLEDGQTLEGDEKLSMSLEDMMAERIQRSMKRALGRGIRKALLKKMNIAAQILQNFVRRKANEGAAFYRGIRVALAQKLQKIYRGWGGKAIAQRLQREQAVRHAGLTLTRIARGMIARQATRRKKKFIVALLRAKNEVSLDALSPDDMDRLADLLEDYIKDYTRQIPMQVLTVLRGILYMFNGIREEIVTIDNSGYIEHLALYASSAGWNSHKLLLRRKGRYLRRLRAIVNHCTPPAPRRLYFTDDTLQHMSEVVRKVREEQFKSMDAKNKATILHLYRFIENIHFAYKLQEEFSDYFIASTPNWYRMLSVLEFEHQKLECNKRVFTYAMRAVEEAKVDYNKRGKKWKAVANSSRKIQTHIDRMDIEIERVEKEYAKKEFVFLKDEELGLQLVYGFKASREYGLEVAQRDFDAFMLKEGDIAPESKIAEMRLDVDKARLKLLDSKNAIYFGELKKKMDLEARDWNKLLNMKTIRGKCKKEGLILGQLMFIREEWTEFIESIGGIQYVYDLTGPKKDYYEATKSKVQSLLVDRRRLIVERDTLLKKEFNNVQRIAHEARMEFKPVNWDNPTTFEIEEEKQEDEDCRKRDADIKAQEARAAKRLRIPAAEFQPLLILIDLRIPQSIAAVIRRRLGDLRFKEVTGTLIDPHLTTEVQQLMDEKTNVYFFVDRGAHVTSRSAFLGYYRSLFYSLIPRPRVVALDAHLELRFENWHMKNAANFNHIHKYNFDDTATATLTLGRLRRTAILFKQFLLCDNEDEERAIGATQMVPDWLRPIFRDDLDDFMASIEGTGDEEDTVMSFNKSLDNAGMILAATVAAILGWWNAPVMEWRERQVQEGCDIFLEHVKDAPTLCNMLWIKKYPSAKVKSIMIINTARRLTHVWEKITTCSYYKTPARYLLSRWVLEAMNLVEDIAEQGGGVEESYEESMVVQYARNLDWLSDLGDPETVGEQLIGDLLHGCFETCMIYEDVRNVHHYHAREDIEDVNKQYFSTSVSRRRVRVYYSHTQIYIGVSIDGYATTNPEWHFFATMSIVEFVSMLQPNGTEIYEGRVQPYDVGPNGKDKWWQIIADWARIEPLGSGKAVNLILLRSRFLVLTKVGLINGHLCRLEIFEERYGEVLILVHGLPNTGTVYLQINNKEMAALLQVCDDHEERLPIELKDPIPVAYIFSDRLQVKPSRSMLWFLQNGELEPRNRWTSPLNVTVRKTGGPGRLLGRKMFTKHGIRFIVTLYELTKTSEVQSIRLLIYENKHSQTFEIRLSDMERMMLFTEDTPIIHQLEDKLTSVYCDTSLAASGQRPLLLLDNDYKHHYAPYVVEGDEEYDVLDDLQINEARRHAGSDAGDIDNMNHSQVDEDDDNGGSVEATLSTADRSKVIEKVSVASSTTLTSKWGWCLTFNRCMVEELRGNLNISVGLNLAMEGFEFWVLDTRSSREAYAFYTYKDVQPCFPGKDMHAMYEMLKTMDEASLLMITDELYKYIDVREGLDSDGVGVSVCALYMPPKDIEGNDTMPLNLAYLREHETTAEEASRRSRQNRTAKMEEGQIKVLCARNLSKVDGLDVRNPIAIVRWNMREKHRTNVVKNDCDPEWADHVSTVSSTRDKTLEQCLLDIEVWDWNFGKARVMDFLGCIRLRGHDLADAFKKGSNGDWVEMTLTKSTKLSERENSTVGGSLVLFALREANFGTNVNRSYLKSGGGLLGAVGGLGGGLFGSRPQTQTSNADTEVAKDPGAVNGESKAADDDKNADAAHRQSTTPGSAVAFTPGTGRRGSPPGKDSSGVDSRAVTPQVNQRTVNSTGKAIQGAPSGHDPKIAHRQTVALRKTRFSQRHRLTTRGVSNPLLNVKGHEKHKRLPIPTALETLKSASQSLSSETPSGANNDQANIGEGAFDTMGGLQSGFLGSSSQVFDGNSISTGPDGLLLPGMGHSQINTEPWQDDATLYTLNTLQTVTDDSYTILDKERLIERRIGVQLQCIEGIPVECKEVFVVIKFNGFVAGCTAPVNVYETVHRNARGHVHISDISLPEVDVEDSLKEESQQTSVLNESITKTDGATSQSSSGSNDGDDKESKETTKEADNDSTTVSTKKEEPSLESLDEEESFISEDRKDLDYTWNNIAEEHSIDSNMTYIIPDRIRRADKNGIAYFPREDYLMIIPPGLEVAACCIEFEVWDVEQGELIGTTDVRGSGLVNLMDNVVGIGSQGSWLNFSEAPGAGGEHLYFENECGDMIAMRSQVKVMDPDHVPVEQVTSFMINIFSLKGVPRYFVLPSDLDEPEEAQAETRSFDSNEEERKERAREHTGLIARVYFNETLVGDTPLLQFNEEVTRSDEKPDLSWKAHKRQPVPAFKLDVIEGVDLFTCKLCIKLLSRKGTGEHEADVGPTGVPWEETTLCSKIITGENLISLLKDEEGEGRGTDMPSSSIAHNSDKLDGRITIEKEELIEDAKDARNTYLTMNIERRDDSFPVTLEMFGSQWFDDEQTLSTFEPDGGQVAPGMDGIELLSDDGNNSIHSKATSRSHGTHVTEGTAASHPQGGGSPSGRPGTALTSPPRSPPGSAGSALITGWQGVTSRPTTGAADVKSSAGHTGYGGLFGSRAASPGGGVPDKDTNNNKNDGIQVIRQNTMAETQDLPSRKLYLNLSNIEISKKKPGALFRGMSMLGMGNSGVGGAGDGGGGDGSDKVGLSLGLGRMLQGLKVLAGKYVDCSKRNSDEAEAYLESEGGRRTSLAPGVKGDRKGSTASMANNKRDSVAGEALDDTPIAPQKGRGETISTRPRRTLKPALSLGQRKAREANAKRVFSLLSTFQHYAKDQDDDEDEDNSDKSDNKKRRKDSLNSDDSHEKTGRSGSAALGRQESSKGLQRGLSSRTLQRGSSTLGRQASTLGRQASTIGKLNLEGEEIEEKEKAPEKGTGLSIDHHAVREVQVFFNGVFIAEVLIPIQYTDTPEAALPQFTRGSSVRRMSNVTPNAGWSGTFSRNGNLDDNSLSTDSRQQENILKEEPKEEEGAMGESKGAKGPFGPEMITMHVPRGQLLSANRLEIVVYELTAEAQKKAVVGLRIFEGQDLVDLFENNSMKEEGVEYTMMSPRSGELRVYDLEAAPNTTSGKNIDGVSLAMEKMVLAGASEVDYTDLVSGLDLGVRHHTPHRGAQGSDNRMKTGSERQKIEVRLLALTGLVNTINPIYREDRTSNGRGSVGLGGGMFSSMRNMNTTTKSDDNDRSRGNHEDADDHQKDSDNVVEDNFPNDENNNILTKEKEEDASILTTQRETSRTTNTKITMSTNSDSSLPRAPALYNQGRKRSSGSNVEENELISMDQDVYVKVRWNGQEIRRTPSMPPSKHMDWNSENPRRASNRAKRNAYANDIGNMDIQDYEAPNVDPTGASSFLMYVPSGHRLKGCYLELSVWQGEDLCLGSVLLHGEDLVSFVRGHGSVSNDADMYDDYDEDDMVSQTHRSFPLDYNRSIPLQAQIEHIQGRLILRGRSLFDDQDSSQLDAREGDDGAIPGSHLNRPTTVTNPYSIQHQNQFYAHRSIDENESDSIQKRKQRNTHNVNLFKIKSRLPRDVVGWRFFYDSETQSRVYEKERQDREEAEKIAAMTDKERAEYLVLKAIGVDAIDGGDSVASGSIGVGGSLGAEDSMSVISFLPVKAEPSFIEQRTGDNLPKKCTLNMVKFTMFLPAVKYLKVVEASIEDCRICWRGRVMPKHFVGGLSNTAKETMMKSRSSRLIKTATLKDTKVLSNVHYLSDFGSEEEVQLDALPIIVKELVTEGAGMCKRIYRVEINTNAGQNIGQADISSDLEFIQAVGQKHSDLFGEHGREYWDMGALFTHIIEERTSIDFSPDKKDNSMLSTRALSILSKGTGGNADDDRVSSAISLIRDQIITTDAKFKALYGLHTFYRHEHMYEDDEMKQEFRRVTQMMKSRSIENQFKSGGLAGKSLAEVESSQGISSKEGTLESVLEEKGAEGEDADADGENRGTARSPPPSRGATSEEKEPINEDEDEDEDSLADISLSDTESDSSTETIDVPMQWLRICTQTHRMSGVTFKTLVLLTGRIPNLWSNPGEFFFGQSTRDALLELNLEFRIQDTFTKKIYTLAFHGAEILGWLSMVPSPPPIDLSTKFRRGKFGEYMLKNLVMRYSHTGEFIFDLINEGIATVTNATKGAMGGPGPGGLGSLLGAGLDLSSGDYTNKREEARKQQKIEKEKLRRERKREKLERMKREAEEEQKRIEVEVAKLKEEERLKKSKESVMGNLMGGTSVGDAMSNLGSSLGGMFGWGKKKK